MSAEFTVDALSGLAALRGLRRAPQLEPAEGRRLRAELDLRLAACDWFTVGVIAPTASAALAALVATERALGWSPLAPDPAVPVPADAQGEVFLKGNQSTGRYQIRAEAGLGEGILITGHCRSDPAAEGTWGPLPLEFFS
jgi:hypothetical protein